jgi:single-strand DNA-binding protein
MKNGINKVTLVGHVGETPRISQFKENGTVANFPIATNEYFTDKEGKEVQKTEWHRVVVWHKQAELIQKFVKKGDPLYVEGRIHTSSYEDKEGVKRFSTEIHCDNFLFLSQKEGN